MKSKTKIFKKGAIIGIAFTMLALTLCAILFMNPTRINAYACSGESATFLTIRTGRVGSLTRTYNSQTPELPFPGNTRGARRRNHGSFEFQRNDANFARNVTGSCIAGIIDTLHGNSLFFSARFCI